MQTKDKTGFVRAEPENMTASAASILADIPEDLIFNLTNKPGKNSYPISGVIYAVCYQTLPAETRQRVVDFLHWATHEGQPDAAKLAYRAAAPGTCDADRREAQDDQGRSVRTSRERHPQCFPGEAARIPPSPFTLL